MFRHFFDAILEQCHQAKLVWGKELYVDGAPGKLSLLLPEAAGSWEGRALPPRGLVTTAVAVLPTLKTLWNGTTEAPIHAASRREVLGRAKGHGERCGLKARVVDHHRNRVKGRPRDQTDHRPEMLEALCEVRHGQEHRAKRIYRNKARQKATAIPGERELESPVLGNWHAGFGGEGAETCV